MNITIIVLTIGIIITALILISIYNGLIRRKNEVENAFGGIDVQLKKRYDLIPNIVSVVKKYVKHELETLTTITKLRTDAMNSSLAMNEKVSLDNKISKEINKITLSAEDYPELKASENFIFLQRTLNEVESHISAARRAFNAAVTEYNNGIQIFPNSIIASLLKMEKKEVFTIPQLEKENIDISKIL